MRARRSVLFCLCGALVLASAISALSALVQGRDSPERSKVGFVGVQAGAEFEAEFQQFRANINFDPKDLARSGFDVTIDVNSVDSKDEERDATMRGPDLFATSRYPTAHYVADRFSAKGDGKYLAAGNLTLRDVTRQVPLEFTYEASANGAWLKGGTTLKRLDFGVGQGEWKDTTLVANEAKVLFAIKLEPST